jgi:alkyldihydroxyacetonephosphate synthase
MSGPAGPIGAGEFAGRAIRRTLDWNLYRLLAVDVDGTLAGADGNVSARTIAALGLAERAGLRVVIVTGRTHQSVVPVWQEAGLSAPLITCGGSLTVQPPALDVLDVHYLPPAVVRQIVRLSHQLNLTVSLWTQRTIWVTGPGPVAEWLQRINEMAILPLGPGDEARLSSGRPSILKAMLGGDPEDLDRCEPAILAALPPATVMRSMRQFFEASPADATKEHALRDVLSRFAIAPHEVIAAGDGENDVGMLTLAGLAVAPSNAMAGPRAVADLIVGRHDREGIAEFLEELVSARTGKVGATGTDSMGGNARASAPEAPHQGAPGADEEPAKRLLPSSPASTGHSRGGMATGLESALVNELQELLGPAAVSATIEDLALHSFDAWPVATKWRQQGKQPFRPAVVVRPTTVDQVVRLMAWASLRGVPVTPWGLGSAVTGAPLPLRGGIALDMAALSRVLLLDDTNLIVRVQAGKLGLELELELQDRGLTLGHSPQSLDRSSVGGWVATRAAGQFSSRYGNIEDLIVALTVVLPTGELIETPLVPRASMGPDLRHLFVGAEGTTGVVVDVTLKVFPLPEHRRLEALRFETVEAGVGAMRRIMRAGLRPCLVGFYDRDEAPQALQQPAFDGCAMFLGVEGVRAVAEAEFAAALDICHEHGGRSLGPAAAEAWMDRRFDFSAVENLLATAGGLAETIEVAHFWDQILETYLALKGALTPYADEVLGHFSHVYPQGTSLYLILLGRAEDDAAAEARLRTIWEVAMKVALERGAAISHHHGIGLARLPYIEEALGTGMLALRRVKAALDPEDVMNPGKLGLGKETGA